MSGEASRVVPYSLKDAPSLIERVFPAQKVSAEAQKERKAGAGQTLTALGSYWKGRKPLILVRACVLGALLPATDDSEADLAIFERLMAIDDDAFEHRVKKRANWPGVLAKSYLERVNECLRPEELPDAAYDGVWAEVNEHLGTDATCFASLVEQLGIMRFGHRPTVADTFAGGGSIPFEAARLGCDAFASDLNPIACMLTWGAYHVIGATPAARADWQASERQRLAAVREFSRKSEIERNLKGHQAKAFLYCLETTCPDGWVVPLSPTWVVSTNQRCIGRLRQDSLRRRFEVEIVCGVSDAELQAAKVGTIRDGRVVYVVDGDERAWSIESLRGDRRSGRVTENDLRPWARLDFQPQVADRLRERLYCIQWIGDDDETYYAAPSDSDMRREKTVESLVVDHLQAWQADGIVPDMVIEPGQKTTELIRTRGWTHWHHLYSPRQLLVLATWRGACDWTPTDCLVFANALNFMSKLCGIHPRTLGSGREMCLDRVFINQALNTLWNYGVRSTAYLPDNSSELPCQTLPAVRYEVKAQAAAAIDHSCDIFITDPPYADAVVYDEITEYFIAWLRRNPPKPFSSWTWDSRRALAIRGEGEEFRQKMVEAYGAMAKHMPDNGLQIVMFTHQSGEVWADMAQIFWGAGLQVMAAWYIATETTSELKKGGYVQGTVILVLRKRKTDEAGYRDEIVQEIKAEVAQQIDTMVGLNQSLKGHGRIENLFEDADLQMAGYAAALRVLTAYARIDGTDMTREALRPRKKGEKSLVSDIIEFAVQVANEHLVPEGMEARVWERLTGSERFYMKMLDIETTGAKKLDNYQNFAKAFRVPDYTELMQSLKPNDARLRNAAQFKKAGFDESEFGRSPTRAALFALYELQADADADVVMAHLRDLVDGYVQKREALIAVTHYVALKRQGIDDGEAKAARILHGLIRNERLGA
jgi:putative DNA methylase